MWGSQLYRWLSNYFREPNRLQKPAANPDCIESIGLANRRRHFFYKFPNIKNRGILKALWSVSTISMAAMHSDLPTCLST